MSRRLCVFFGVGLILLWIAELAAPGLRLFAYVTDTLAMVRWITWLDLCAGLIALFLAGAPSPATLAGGMIALGIGCFALWIIALSAGIAPWTGWWNFAFGCAFVLTNTSRALVGQNLSRFWQKSAFYLTEF